MLLRLGRSRAGGAWATRPRAPSPKSPLPAARAGKVSRKPERGLQILFPFVRVAGAGSSQLAGGTLG